MIPRSGGGGPNVNPGRVDEVFADHAPGEPADLGTLDPAGRLPGLGASTPTGIRTPSTPKSAESAPRTSAFESRIRADKPFHTEPSSSRTQSRWILPTAYTCSWRAFLDPVPRNNTHTA